MCPLCSMWNIPPYPVTRIPALHSNCLVYALRRWWTDGGYILISKSRYTWLWHFMWSPDLKTFLAFVPLAPKRKRRFPPLWFAGKVRPMVIRQQA